MTEHDAVVVGAGPNGLAAAIALAQAGRSVLVLEANDSPGGGARSAELTLPGFVHDLCSGVHPLAVASPFFRSLNLEQHGLEWVQPPAAMAHPFDDGTAALLERSTAATGAHLGADAGAYRRLMDPFVARWQNLYEDALAPPRLPRHPFLMARFGLLGLRSTTRLTRRWFREERTRALFAGIAAHATLPLDEAPSAAFGLILGVAGHAVGWPIPRGGAGRITDALVGCLQSLGGEVRTGSPVASLDDLPAARTVLLDVTAPELLRLAGDRLPPGYRSQLQRVRPGLGTFKVDWALDGPIPWRAAECARASTVHLGSTLDEIASSHAASWAGRDPEQPFVILSQPTLFDPSRAPAGKHVAWAYCHPPHGSTTDMTHRIEAQIERFAPGFRDRILARNSAFPVDLERSNRNLAGGDIDAGVSDLRQLFFRPVLRLPPYATPLPGVFICSAATPPGPAVHGMCGYHAAQAALHSLGVGSPHYG